MPALKKRLAIDPQIAAQIQYLSDRTCCICQAPGKPIQIHHLDENPSNGAMENLAVLCIECHDRTQQKGGFGRQLDQLQIAVFRDEWYKRIAERRRRADEQATENTLPQKSRDELLARGLISTPFDEIEDVELKQLYRYVLFLPALKRNAIEVSQPLFDTGGALAQASAIQEVIELVKRILTKLLDFYDSSYFESESREIMVRRLSSQISDWHNLIYRPEGEGTEGTMVYPWIYSRVLSDIDDMVVDVVRSLDYCKLVMIGFDFDAWETRWRQPTFHEDA